MAYSLDLSGAWAKVDRANGHVDTLLASMNEAGRTEPHPLPVIRRYENESGQANEGAVVFRVGEVSLDSAWRLIAGDVIHNARCALDHLAWQLALRFHNGGPIPRAEVRNVQFPIETSDGKRRHPYWKNMTPDDALVVDNAQPYKYSPPDQHTFAGIRDLSNEDKHRLVITTESVVSSAQAQQPFQLPGESLIPASDCVITGPPQLTGLWAEPGQEVARVPVIVTGPQPDVDFDLTIEGIVMLKVKGDLYPLLETMQTVIKAVANLLVKFQPSP